VIKKIILIAVNALLLLAFIACVTATGIIKDTLQSQKAAERWAGQSGERFAQVSAFITDGFMLDDEAIHYLREDVNKAFITAGVEASAGRKLYTDAWSAEGSLFVSGVRGAASANVLGVGGDFFLFHPLYLRDGSYLLPGDLMKDRVVLDEELAWRLFGSVDLAGLEVKINDRPIIIAGVVSRETDFASTRAYTGGGAGGGNTGSTSTAGNTSVAGMFMPYELLSELSAGARINCYEIVMPDPISGFAFKTITESFPDKRAHIVDNTARYLLGNTFKNIGSFGERSIRSDRMVYPYWENAARYTEDWLALLLALSLVFIICPVVCGVIYSVRVILFVVRRSKKKVAVLIDERDDRKAEKYLQQHPEESMIFDVNEIIREVMEEQEQVQAQETIDGG